MSKMHKCIECEEERCQGECGCRCGWLAPRHMSAAIYAQERVLEQRAAWAREGKGGELFPIYEHARKHREMMREWEEKQIQMYRRSGKVEKCSPGVGSKGGSGGKKSSAPRPTINLKEIF